MAPLISAESICKSLPGVRTLHDRTRAPTRARHRLRYARPFAAPASVGTRFASVRHWNVRAGDAVDKQEPGHGRAG
jgi:hypothetical protein